MKSYCIRWLPVILFFIVAFFLWRGLSGNPAALPSALLAQALPSFELPLLPQKAKETFSSSQLKGRVTLLNVFASWCAACEEEQAFLLQLAHEGIAIYGLNEQDNPDDALRWLNEWGNPYIAIGADTGGRVGIDLGVYGTPETFLIDKEGVIQYRHAGILNHAIWQKEFLPRITRMAISSAGGSNAS